MNDDELITILREQRDKVPMNTPVEQIISRGRAVRARRRVPAVAGALGAAAAVAFAVSAALPAATRQPPCQRAWCPAGGLDGRQAGRRQYPGHHPRAARPGRTPAHAPRRRRPGQRHLHRPAEPGVPGLPRRR